MTDVRVDAELPRFRQAATVHEVTEVLDFTRSALLDMVDYMIADWGKPEEDKKKAAIDNLLGRLREAHLLYSKLTGLPEQPE